ncbi:piggyBac transposable element-derived protein 2-like [Myxocyprinus asiaticus]|uniref:piggyBac transposable element-derived protein 2-like n=1 Tax=Myxocyprinus asiaticus TaxID=70543 RepID=UPI00222377E4|nr:piggyBac transposable element-derived protein 2-like [Myxocyprinus asiaticus]
MDIRLFYGRKEQDPHVRQIPSDSEDSEIDSSDSEEECNGEKDTLDTSEHEDEDTDEDDSLSEDDSSFSKTPRWKMCHTTASPVHPEWLLVPPSADEILSPYQYFKSLPSDNFFELTVNESNLYSIQCNPANPLNLTVQELEQFFGTLLHMSLFGLQATRMFWSQSSCIAHVVDVMPLAQWETIKIFLHFSDNSCQPTRDMADYDELYKIQPLLNHILIKLKQLPMRETLSVDEQMVPFKGKSRIKQYLLSKPRKWGYKILVLAGSNGVPHNFEVYTGKAVHPPELPDIGASGNVVLRLAEPVLTKRNFKLFFDSWFSLVPLMLVLSQQGIHFLGTVCSNCLPGSSMMPDADLKRFCCGSFQEKTAYVRDTQLHAVKWYDNRPVTLLSSYVGAQPVSHVDRWNKGQKKTIKVSCTAAVSTYNQHMGGVDLDSLDSLIDLYRTNIRSKKWYHRLVFNFINMAVVTCWLIYRRDCADNGMARSDHMCLYAFKSLIEHSLCKSKKDARKRGRTSGGIS